MSGIDCSTQMLNQQYTEPFLAIVIDPVRTCAAGRGARLAHFPHLGFKTLYI